MAETNPKDVTRTLVRGLEKRKACDLCHIKKIKCDAKKPTCTHCSVYGAQCAYTPHIKKRRKEVTIQPSTAPAQTPDTAAVPDAATGPSLPRLDVLLPRVDDYFSNLNNTIPLFDQATFMRMLQSSFPTISTGTTSDPLLTAALHAILALTYQHKATSLPPPYPEFTHEDSVSAVESLTSNLELCSHAPRAKESQHGTGSDLLGLQVLLAYTMYKLGTPRPGAVAYLASLLGRIIKLVHRLELNRCATNAHFFDEETSLQRARVFWIAYILDRHISMNSQDPPLQQDDDIDVPIPPSSAGYGLITFLTSTGQEIQFDFFASRIYLARIQGIIYNLVYSVRASNQSFESLAQNVQRIRGMLADWLGRVPVGLYPENLERGLVVGPPSALRELVVLYFNYMFCLMHTHKVGHHHAEWIARLVGYSQEIVGVPSLGTSPVLSSDSAVGSDIGAGGNTTWVSSPGWEELVKTARECARLFRLIGRDDTALLWMTTCAYISASLVLVANRLTTATTTDDDRLTEHRTQDQSAVDRPQAEVEEEDKLIAEAVQYLEQGAAEMPQPNAGQLERMAAALGELSCRARIARARFGFLTTSNGDMMNTRSSAVSWLENEARKSAGFSALDLVQAFTGAEQKTISTRVFSGALVQ
ncbi:Fungal specific transcription factor domain containing protein [Naviculisporaceae sp. PSN 640]